MGSEFWYPTARIPCLRHVLIAARHGISKREAGDGQSPKKGMVGLTRLLQLKPHPIRPLQPHIALASSGVATCNPSSSTMRRILATCWALFSANWPRPM